MCPVRILGYTEWPLKPTETPGGSPAAGQKAWPHNCLKVHPKGELRISWKVRQRRLFGRTYAAELPDSIFSQGRLDVHQ
jgi:hypothetical protein